MITKDLYKIALIEPCLEGADELHIVSGYATSAMASRHIEDLHKKKLSIKISLLVGMCPTDGIALGNHKGFQSIVSDRFACSYITSKPPVHGKLYIWYKEKKLLKSFIGSANYTQNAFFNRHREVLTEISDADVAAYFKSLERDSIDCTHNEVEDAVCLINDKHYYNRHPNEAPISNGSQAFEVEGLQSERVSLLMRRGKSEVHNRAGLNWGQRLKRNRNQAYIQLPPEVYKSDFFPPRPQQFTILTDDSKILICSRCEKQTHGGHAIHSVPNSLLGEYFRNRLGVPNGVFVTTDDLLRYGRTDVVFYKLDNENYLMDFSVS